MVGPIAQLIGRLRKGGDAKQFVSKIPLNSETLVQISGNSRMESLRSHGIDADIMYLPGHTDDSIGLKLPDGRLFCGDAAMNGLPAADRHSIIVEDWKIYHDTWQAILDSDVKWVYPSHGLKFPVSDLAKYFHAQDASRKAI
jgi:glyoxylase-like metal-dependent hydrolase (beta-lactamase superfamily II)